MLAQVVSTSPPNGVTRPSPVTTTRRIVILQTKQAQPVSGLSLSKPEFPALANKRGANG
jgi:hypothetical protein